MVPFLMGIDTWLPIFIGLSLYIPILICASCLPKSLGIDRVCSAPSQLKPTDNAENGKCVHGYKAISIDAAEQQPKQWHSSPESGVGLSKRFSAFLLIIRDNSTVSALFVTFLITVFSNSAHENLLQFARNRFGWSWSQVSSLEPSLDAHINSSDRPEPEDCAKHMSWCRQYSRRNS